MRTIRSGRDDPSTRHPIEAVWRPARDQDHENRPPDSIRPSRWSLRTSRLRHSSVVRFLLNLYQLPLPTPPTRIFASNFLPKSLARLRELISPHAIPRHL